MTRSRGATTLRLQTDRLDLIALTAELVDALANRHHAERLLGAALPEGWPDSELAGLLKICGPWIAEDPVRLGYGPWVLVARDEGSAVGSAGFMGKPPENGEPIELGYGVHPNYRNRGYATEATRALVAWGLSQTRVERVFAKCDPENAPSVRVLEKIGMTRCGQEGAMLLWEATAG
jgi:[ribosomal protein S5]-alanine N-acetyltransferase